MYVQLRRPTAQFVSALFIVLFTAVAAAAQDPAHGDHANHEQAAPEQITHDHMDHEAMASGMPATREGSGTSWLPDQSPMYAIHRRAGDWMVMLHGNAFLQYLEDRGPRGHSQLGSINWFMTMAERSAGVGRVMLRGMVSAEPWTIRGCGYPDLLATGELCEGEPIHDRQHPHDLFMELAARYDRPLGRGVRLQLYGGPVGEPALGPVAFVHRVSALPNPVAPITHHWFDSTHITYGVATAGVYGARWKAEGSVFNGREPDEHRLDFDLARLDSWSARVWYLPTSRWALQVSGGHLNEAEASDHEGEPRIDVNRVTASATYHRGTAAQTLWATTAGWGRNAESGEASHAILGETSLTLHDRDAFYARIEWSQKDAHDLVVATPGTFDILKVQGGYTRYLPAWGGLRPGIGATVTTGIVPETLRAEYGSRANTGFGVYLTLRPAAQ